MGSGGVGGCGYNGRWGCCGSVSSARALIKGFVRFGVFIRWPYYLLITFMMGFSILNLLRSAWCLVRYGEIWFESIVECGVYELFMMCLSFFPAPSHH